MEMDNAFSRVREIINRLTDILKCQKCFQLREHEKVFFYRSCHHFFCSECLSDSETCSICPASAHKPIHIPDDKSMLCLYQSVLRLELPSKDDIKLIYESCKRSKEIADESQDKEEKEFKEIKSESKSQCKKSTIGMSDINVKENEEVESELKNNVIHSEKESKSNKKRKALVAALSENNDSSLPKSTTKDKKKNKKKKLSVSPGKKENEVSIDVNVTPVRNIKAKDLSSNEPGSARSDRSINKSSINKRNAKGETKLHVACKKSDLNKVRDLINEGADPNIHDFAGWTPLHESVYAGNADIIKFLLENGAKINLPGPENTTALHEAIAHGKTEIVKILMEYGADINAMNVLRETPLMMAKKNDSTEMEKILLSYGSKRKVTEEEGEESMDSIVIYKHNLSVEHEKLVNKLSEKFGLKIVSSLTGKYRPTHVIVSNDRFDVTWGLVSLVLTGCWLVSVDWVEECMEKMKMMPAGPFQMREDKFSGFAKGRQNKRNMLPGLFCGCHFFFGGNVKTYNVKNITVGAEDLQQTIEKNGGKIVKRCPDPESLSLEKTIPYHADPTGSLKMTAYYIIYQEGKWVPPLKYGMAHMKTLPIDWLISSIFRFELIDPIAYRNTENYL